jgi:hypothetical protein
MKKILTIVLLVVLAIMTGAHAYALAAAPGEVVPPAFPVETITMRMVPAATSALITPTPRQPTPEPTPTPEWPTPAKYDEGEARCLARYAKSTIPGKATWVTIVAAMEVPQNRVDSGEFADTIRYTLLQGDFGGYHPDAMVTNSNLNYADYVMRSWAEWHNGDNSHRYTPPCGIYLSYYDKGKYVKVYDENWNMVFDSGWFK